MRFKPILFAALIVLAACGGGSESNSGAPAGSAPPGSTPPSPTVADITVLMMGNSHTVVNRLPEMLAAMVRAARPGKSVAVVVAPGLQFLEERLQDSVSVNLLRSQSWSVVILQAQKYSSSGLFTYSTAEAVEWIRLARKSNALPIMFPEWPRLGVPETQRIFDLHVSIAKTEPACVAPIGQAWDLSLTRYPLLVLHDADGNHSSPAGAFLAALVLYATVTGLSSTDLPFLPEFPIDAPTQASLRMSAAQTVQSVPPRQWCPGDPPA